MIGAGSLGRLAGGSEATMRVWFGRMPAAVCWLVVTAAVGAAPPAEQLHDWIRLLDSEDFATREVAAQSLAAAGQAAIEPLAAASVSSSAESAWRATAILEQIAISGGDATLSRVAATLQRLSSEGKPGLATVASELHAKRDKLRHDRAAARIRALGGKFAGDGLAEPVAEILEAPPVLADEEEEAEIPTEVAEPAGIEALGAALKLIEGLLSGPAADVKPHPLPDPPLDLPPVDLAPVAEVPLPFDVFIADAFVGPGMVEAESFASGEESLVLDQSWRGGDEGLSALGDLTRLSSLSLHRARLSDGALDKIAALPSLATLDAEGMSFSRQAWARFRERRPSTRIFARGEALLGISADVSGPCVVTSVVGGSGAAKAGLEPGDEVIAVDGQKVRDFSDLTIAISNYKPGDKVRIKCRRNGQQQTAEAALQQRKP